VYYVFIHIYLTVMAEEVEAGSHTVSVSTEHIQDHSPTISDALSYSKVAAGSSLSIDQMVRDFIIAKTKGMNGNDRGADSIKSNQDRKGHHKSNKDKKKKKKTKHKSQRRESSSKHRRHHRRDHKKSSDSSKESNSSDNDRQQYTNNDETSNCLKSDDDAKRKDGPLTSTENNKKCQETSSTNQESANSTDIKETFLNGVCSKCSTCGRQIGTAADEQKTKTDELQCHCQNPTKADGKAVKNHEAVLSEHKSSTRLSTNTDKSHRQCDDKCDCVSCASSLADSSGKHCISQAKVTAGLQYSRDAVCHSPKQSTVTLPRKHLDDTRKSTKQDDKHVSGANSKSRHYTDNNKMSDSPKKQHSNIEHKCIRDDPGCDKPVNTRKRSPSLEKASEKHTVFTKDDKSDDVVFMKKTSSREKMNRDQKLSRENSRSTVFDDSSRHGGSKRRYDIGSSIEDDSGPQCKNKKEGRHAKDSSVILVSDDEVDVLSEEMMEKLHKRLTTSIKKSKELQAERESANLKSGDFTASHSTESTEKLMCFDAAETQNIVASPSEIALPPDMARIVSASHVESLTDEQSAVKSTTVGLFGKKTLKFGLKISESSAAFISKGITSSDASGKKVLVCCLSYF